MKIENSFPKWITEVPDISRDVSLEIFYELIENVHSIMGLLGDRSYSMPKILSTNDKMHILFADFFNSIDNTLKSTLVCTRMGNFSDANILLRKYRDNLFQWLFIINSIDLIDGKKLDDILGDMPGDEFSDESVERLSDAILSWFQDPELNAKWRKQYFDITPYITALQSNILIKTCFDSYLKTTWDLLGTDLNNYTHGNGKLYLISNNIRGYSKKVIESQIEGLVSRLWKTTACFLSVLILDQSYFIMSSDYTDYMDFGQTPPENSQYWVAPIIQDFIDKYITRIHPDLKRFLKDNNPYHMEIE